MSAPILTTKLFVPFVPSRAVLRSRLIKKLNQSEDKALTLVSAPAGFGKTTLVASWLSTQAKPAAWVSLDEYDNDPVRFFSYVITALCHAKMLEGENCENIIQSANFTSLENLYILLTNQLAKIEQPGYLILDDYHLIEKEDVHQILSMLIESYLSNFHIIVISRTEPPLSIAKMRAQNQLVEINLDDLRFNSLESTDYLNTMMELGLSQQDILKLEQQTEGWITGLQLVALSLKNSKSSAQEVSQITGGHWYIADYLIGEVLSKQPPEIQEFLIKTSILERMSADLCNAVMEISDSQFKLEQLEKANLFLISLDEYREWYRYHHLFAEMLQSRLQSFSNEKINGVYWRAFEWHKEKNLLEAAVKYGIEGEFYEQAADIIETVGGDVYWHNRAHTLHEWLDHLPQEILADRPHLQILSAYNTIDHGDIQGTEKAILKIRNNLLKVGGASSQRDDIIEGKLAAIEMAVAYHRYMDSQRCIQLASIALNLLPESYEYDRTVAAFHAGGAYLWAGQLDLAEKYLQLAMSYSNQFSNPLANLLTRSNYGYLELKRGQLQLARQHFLQVHQIANQIKVRQGSTFSKAVIGLATLHYEWNQLETATQMVEEGIQLVSSGEFLDRMWITYQIAVRIEISHENYAQAHQCIKELDGIGITCNADACFFEKIDLLNAFLALHENNFYEAERWATKYAFRSDLEVSSENEEALLVFARIRTAQERYQEAIEILCQCLALAQEQGRRHSEIQIEVLLAKAYQQLGNLPEAEAHLIQALVFGEIEKYTRTFLDAGESIKIMLERIQQNGSEKSNNRFSKTYVEYLLENYSLETRALQKKMNASSSGELLTDREMDVLQGLAKGLSYDAIGEQLSISKNTVRSHIKSIYSKLGVSNRTQALIEAQNADLLKYA